MPRGVYGPKVFEFKLSNRDYQFAAQIDRIVANTEARLLAVVKQSLNDMLEDAQKPVAQGGKMRVDTGFLRHSGVAALNVAPSGQSIPVKGQRYSWDGNTIVSTLTRMKLGDVFYFGWLARYAKYREAYDGFLESAVQKWQTYVDSAVSYYRNKDVK